MQPIYSQTKSESNKSEIICQALTEIVNDGKAPGMIAAIISSEGVIAIGSAGVRKAGSGIARNSVSSIFLLINFYSEKNLYFQKTLCDK